jgi:hypothetical protein
MSVCFSYSKCSVDCFRAYGLPLYRSETLACRFVSAVVLSPRQDGGSQNEAQPLLPRRNDSGLYAVAS